MTFTRTFIFTLLLVLAQPLIAQSYGKPSSGLTERTTNKVVRLLERGLNQCQRIDSVYRYDCYRQNYRKVAQEIAGNPAYDPAYKALQQLQSTLATVLQQNADTSAKKLRRRGQTYSAILPSAVPKSKAAFTATLNEASTRLLRSPDGTSNHFARIASALDSEKVFLRS